MHALCQELFSRFCTSTVFTHIILTTTLGSRYYYFHHYLCFSDGETKTQGSQKQRQDLERLLGYSASLPGVHLKGTGWMRPPKSPIQFYSTDTAKKDFSTIAFLFRTLLAGTCWEFGTFAYKIGNDRLGEQNVTFQDMSEKKNLKIQNIRFFSSFTPSFQPCFTDILFLTDKIYMVQNQKKTPLNLVSP